ncbi:nuclear transport factor 2 family protein [Patulibacter minatonensis]|uniref:nuclear transport factor 2 family protein n=1 Tax=Patulibacter minatonensis TaxID=298163 RepID=UPI00047CAB14|nr:nuclear transport factor 2 family protein [Patulibacter minatonensis]
MPHDNVALITRFYAALDSGDAAAMGACYAPDATFTDTFFKGLRGPEVPGMWDMLLRRATEMSVVTDEIEADDTTGSAHWVATYPFAKTGRTVVNDIRARFRFRDGLIVEHVDRFDARRWGAQAFGPAGNLLVLPPARMLLSRAVKKDLDKHLARG